MLITTIADAVATLEYLMRRELICQRCGSAPATVRNVSASLCDGCRSPNARYDAVAPANPLESAMVKAFVTWLAMNA